MASLHIYFEGSSSYVDTVSFAFSQIMSIDTKLFLH